MSLWQWLKNWLPESPRAKIERLDREYKEAQKSAISDYELANLQATYAQARAPEDAQLVLQAALASAMQNPNTSSRITFAESGQPQLAQGVFSPYSAQVEVHLENNPLVCLKTAQKIWSNRAGMSPTAVVEQLQKENYKQRQEIANLTSKSLALVGQLSAAINLNTRLKFELQLLQTPKLVEEPESVLDGPEPIQISPAP